MRRLARLCEHGRMEEHTVEPHVIGSGFGCSGGEFLSDDVLVIEKVNGEWPEWATRIIRQRKGAAFAALDALTVRVSDE